jgi:hypothetical protein
MAAARGQSVLEGDTLYFTDGAGGARLAPGWRRVGDVADVGAAAAARAAYEHVDGRRTHVPTLVGCAAGATAAAAAPAGGAFSALTAPPRGAAGARVAVSPPKDFEVIRPLGGGASELFFLDGPGGARLARGWRRVTDGVDV